MMRMSTLMVDKRISGKSGYHKLVMEIARRTGKEIASSRRKIKSVGNLIIQL